MKKQICLVMTAMMAAGMLAGCSGSAKETTAATEAATTAAETTAEETTAKETTAAASGEETEILVAAAASLKNAYEDKLIPMFEEQYPEVSIEGTYDSSGKLQSQIEAGADVDIFFSAALKQMEALQEEGYPIESRKRIGYRLVTDADLLTEEAVREYLHTRTLGQQLLVFPELDSTNAYCRKLLQKRRQLQRHGSGGELPDCRTRQTGADVLFAGGFRTVFLSDPPSPPALSGCASPDGVRRRRCGTCY